MPAARIRVGDERGAACAVRRLREELGAEGLAVRPRSSIEYRARVGSDMIEHEVVEVFAAEASADLTLAPNPAEVEDVRWVALDALRAEVADHPDRFTAWMRIYMAEHLHDILGDVAP